MTHPRDLDLDMTVALILLDQQDLDAILEVEAGPVVRAQINVGREKETVTKILIVREI